MPKWGKGKGEELHSWNIALNLGSCGHGYFSGPQPVMHNYWVLTIITLKVEENKNRQIRNIIPFIGSDLTETTLGM